jgi:hypothetical protein
MTIRPIVTGASSGIGHAIAARLAAEGYRMFGTSRTDPSLSVLDMTDLDSCDALVARILDETGRIDVLVNNAGYSMLGAQEELSYGEVRAMFETECLRRDAPLASRSTGDAGGAARSARTCQLGLRTDTVALHERLWRKPSTRSKGGRPRLTTGCAPSASAPSRCGRASCATVTTLVTILCQRGSWQLNCTNGQFAGCLGVGGARAGGSRRPRRKSQERSGAPKKPASGFHSRDPFANVKHSPKRREEAAGHLSPEPPRRSEAVASPAAGVLSYLQATTSSSSVSGSTAVGSSDRITRSASLPTSIEPFRSSSKY